MGIIDLVFDYPYASAAIVPHAARGEQQAGRGFIA